HPPQSRPTVAAALDQHFEDLAFVVDGTPEIHPLAGDPNDHLTRRGLDQLRWALVGFVRIVTLSYRGQKRPKRHARSHCGHRIPRSEERRVGKEWRCWWREEQAKKNEGVVDRGMHAEEALSRSSRIEALHFALSSPHRLVLILG